MPPLRRCVFAFTLAVAAVALCGLTRPEPTPPAAAVPELELTFLGTGAAWPVPRLGCTCGTCDAARGPSPRTRRMRSSLKIGRGPWLLADVGPDTYTQLSALPSPRPAGVLLTHAHHDHCGGVSDLHPLVRGVPIPLLTDPRVFDELVAKAPYARTTFALRDSTSPVRIGDWTVRHVPLEHGTVCVGFRVEARGHAIAYVTDVDRVPAAAPALLAGLDVMVLDGTNVSELGTAHLRGDGIVALIAATQPKRVVFTHVGHHAAPHERTQAMLDRVVPGALLAYDGMTL